MCGVLMMIPPSWVKMVGTVVSSTLTNGGDKTVAPAYVAVECEWRVCSRDRVRIAGQGIGDGDRA